MRLNLYYITITTIILLLTILSTTIQSHEVLFFGNHLRLQEVDIDGRKIRFRSARLTFTFYIPDGYDATTYPYGVTDTSQSYRTTFTRTIVDEHTVVLDAAFSFSSAFYDEFNIYLYIDDAIPYTVISKWSENQITTPEGWDNLIPRSYCGTTATHPLSAQFNEAKDQITMYVTHLRFLQDEYINERFSFGLHTSTNVTLSSPSSITLLNNEGIETNASSCYGTNVADENESPNYILKCTTPLPSDTSIMAITFPITMDETANGLAGVVGYFTPYLRSPTNNDLLAEETPSKTTWFMINPKHQDSMGFELKQIHYPGQSGNNIHHPIPSQMRHLSRLHLEFKYNHYIYQFHRDDWNYHNIADDGHFGRMGPNFIISTFSVSAGLEFDDYNLYNLYSGYPVFHISARLAPQIPTVTAQLMLNPFLPITQSTHNTLQRNYFLPFDILSYHRYHAPELVRSIPIQARHDLQEYLDKLPDYKTLIDNAFDVIPAPYLYHYDSILENDIIPYSIKVLISGGFPARSTLNLKTFLPSNILEALIPTELGDHITATAQLTNSADINLTPSKNTPTIISTEQIGFHELTCDVNTANNSDWSYPIMIWSQFFQIHKTNTGDIYFINKDGQSIPPLQSLPIRITYKNKNLSKDLTYTPSFPFVPTSNLESTLSLAIVPTLPSRPEEIRHWHKFIVVPNAVGQPDDLNNVDVNSLWRHVMIQIFPGTVIRIDFTSSTSNNVNVDDAIELGQDANEDEWVFDIDNAERVVTITYTGSSIITVDREIDLFHIPFLYKLMGDELITKHYMSMSNDTSDNILFGGITTTFTSEGNYQGGQLTITTTDNAEQSLPLLIDYVSPPTSNASNIIMIPNGNDIGFKLTLTNAMASISTTVTLMTYDYEPLIQDAITNVITPKLLHTFTSPLTSTDSTIEIIIPATIKYTTKAFLRFTVTKTDNDSEIFDSTTFIILPNCFVYPENTNDYQDQSKYTNTCPLPTFTMKFTDIVDRTLSTSTISPPTNNDNIERITIGTKSTFEYQVTYPELVHKVRFDLMSWDSGNVALISTLGLATSTGVKTTTIPSATTLLTFIRITILPTTLITTTTTYDSELFYVLPLCKTYPMNDEDINNIDAYINVCVDNATCSLTEAKCICNEGFFGETCQPPSKCENYCITSNLQECIETAIAPQSPCKCRTGYTGDKCEIDPPPSKCKDYCVTANISECIETAESPTSPCKCRSGFSGDKCDINDNTGGGGGNTGGDGSGGDSTGGSTRDGPNNTFNVYSSTITIINIILSVILFIHWF